METSNTTHPDIHSLSTAFYDFARLWHKAFSSVVDYTNLDRNLDEDMALYGKFNNACRLISETMGEITARDIRRSCKVK